MTPSHATGRQRGDASLPVGNSSGRKMSAAPVEGSQIQVSVHPTSRTNGNWPGNASAPAIVYSIANASIAKHDAHAREQPADRVERLATQDHAPIDPVVTAAS